ncbi:hypothetical protein FV113G1_22620 [Fusobacterium varium]|nr:hypothetical protein FV113G1_22620 [Fusobacterium varium]
MLIKINEKVVFIECKASDPQLYNILLAIKESVNISYDLCISEKSWEELTLYQKSDIFIKALNAIFGFVKLFEKKNIDSKNLCQF